MVGSMLTTMVMTKAAIWVRTRSDTRRPMPVLHNTNTTEAARKNGRLPLNGTRNQRVAMIHRTRAFTEEIAT